MTSLGGSATLRSFSDLLSRRQIFNINNVASANDYKIDAVPRDVKFRDVKRTGEIVLEYILGSASHLLSNTLQHPTFLPLDLYLHHYYY
jgi:hypothetical protein